MRLVAAVVAGNLLHSCLSSARPSGTLQYHIRVSAQAGIRRTLVFATPAAAISSIGVSASEKWGVLECSVTFPCGPQRNGEGFGLSCSILISSPWSTDCSQHSPPISCPRQILLGNRGRRSERCDLSRCWHSQTSNRAIGAPLTLCWLTGDSLK